MNVSSEHKHPSRLDFLKASGALIVAVGLSVVFTTDVVRTHRISGERWVPVMPDQLDSWLAIGPDGHVTIFTGKVDLGGGVQTGFAQIAAEELDVPVDHITVLMGDTARTVDQGYTADSSTIAGAGPHIRQAAADARQILLARASAHLKAPVGSLTVQRGIVRIKGRPARSISYAALIGGKQFAATIPVKTVVPINPSFAGFVLGGKGKPKHPSEYSIVGRSVARVDIPAKVTGEFVYMQDLRVLGMLHGRVIRPRGIGSKLLSYGTPPPGVQVAREGNFLAVVAASEWDAIQAAQNLPVTWSTWEGLPTMDQLYATLRTMPSVDRVVARVGQVEVALGGAARVLAASYETPMETHGSIGPSCAIADVQAESVTIWSGTQGPHFLRGPLAELLGVPTDQVRVIHVDASGCYGRNGADPAAIDAAIISKHIGRPVRVQWMRSDEHGWDPKGPATAHDLRGGLDAHGNILGWQHEGWMPPSFATMLIGSVLIGRPVGLAGRGGWDATVPYTFPNFQQIEHGLPDLGAATNGGIGLITSWLRSPTQFQVTFAMESFIDELAAIAGADPVQFRLRHLRDRRMIDLLTRVAKAAGWQRRPSPRPGARSSSETVVTGRGVAISLRVGTYNAEVAEVEVNRLTGQVRVLRIVAGQDNGLTINPRAVRLHMEGGITQTVSRTLLEEVTFDRSNVTSLDWSSYPILTFMDAPKIETILVDRPDLPATGVGEPCINPVAPAICNALFDATGVRIRRLPLRLERVKAALDAHR
jgi:CO/xanthine dehydrogenase Mo-binding subunit